MNRLKTMIPVLAALLAVAMTGPAAADTLLTLKIHTDAVDMPGMRQEARDTESTVWVGDQRVRRDDGKVTSILRLDHNKLYVIDHDLKTYNAFDLPIDFRKLFPEGGDEMMAQMTQMAKMDVTITPRPGKLKIGDWETRRYDVEMTNPVGMKIETTMWTSNEIGVDVATLTKMSRAMTSLQPGTFDWVKKMETIEGYPVLQESTVTMMGKPFKTSEKLVAVQKQEPPAGHYDPPAGYKEKPFDPMRPIGRP